MSGGLAAVAGTCYSHEVQCWSTGDFGGCILVGRACQRLVTMSIVVVKSTE